MFPKAILLDKNIRNRIFRECKDITPGIIQRFQILPVCELNLF